MKTRNALCGFMSGLLLLAAGTLTAHAEVISENFNGGTLPATMEISGSNLVFTGGAVLFPGTAEAERTYLRTVAANFYSRSFVAEVTVTTDSIAWFGMGDGTPNPGFFDEPGAPSINLRMHPSWLVGGRVDAGDNVVDFSSPLNTFGYPGSGTHRLRLTWDATAKTAVFQIHENYTGGPFVASLTSPAVNGADNGFTDSSTRIFFGGAGSISFDDFHVTDTGSNLFAADGIVWHQPLARSGMSEDTNPGAGGTLKYRFKLGSTIPIKVHALGTAGNDVTGNANVTSKVVVFGDTDMNGVADTGALPIDFNGVGEAGGVMDKIGGHLKYNLDTKKLPPTFKCYILQVTVTDTSTGETIVETLPLQSK